MKRFKYIIALWLAGAGMLVAQPLVRDVSAPYSITQGLQGSHIALWASHGCWYNQKKDRWQWQRGRLFETVEDLYTSSYTQPYLVPMLEHAGALVLEPRERDPQAAEQVVEDYLLLETDSVISQHAFIRLKVRQPGDYAVYVRYPSDRHNIPDAHLALKYNGGETFYLLNETMDQNSWIYLCNRHFDNGEELTAEINNLSAEEGHAVLGGLRIGGGMGSIRRGGSASGYPRYAEAARYYLEYDGFPASVWHTQETDYKDDLYARGNWVNYLRQQRNVPIDLSLALHTDAGITRDSSIIGTLLIYSHPNEQFSRLMQDQLVSDIQRTYAPEWHRRSIEQKDYVESRVPEVPAILIELLSHQNLADMRYGLDPRFRFLAARAMYKAVLKYQANRQDTSYCVQPLPVRIFSARLRGDSVLLRWKAELDSLEPTAAPTSYVLYTAKGKASWDNGQLVTGDSLLLPLEKDTHYRFRICAANSGGLSMPSETLGVYRCSRQKGEAMVINGFTRVCAPASIDQNGYGGFLPDDPGIPDGRDYFRTGYQYDLLRQSPWTDDDAPGWGASYEDWEHSYLCGNTHDYAYQEGRLWAERRFSYSSSTAAAIEGDWADTCYTVLDYILGEQKQTPLGKRVDFACFPQNICTEIGQYAQRHRPGLLLISGSHVGDDLQGDKSLQQWAKSTLHFTYRTDHATRTGLITDARSKRELARFETEPNKYVCPATSADVLAPADGRVLLRYGSNQKSAATSFDKGKLRIVVLGFPILAIRDEADRLRVLHKITE